MEELISRVSSAAGIDADLAEKAVGMILGFLQKEGPASEIGQLMEAMPGAETLAAAHAAAPAGGLMGGLMSMMGGAGGVMALGQQLMGAGIGMGQITAISKEVFAYGREKVGEETMGKIVAAVPGLSQFV